MRTPLAATSFFVALACCTFSHAADSALEAFFETKIRPVLVEHCLGCHGDKKQKGGLRLDSREAILQGGLSGPAVLTTEPDKSLLLRAIRHTDNEIRMPPKGKLPDEAIEALSHWIRLGAPWPMKAAPLVAGDPDAEQTARQHWAFQPVRMPFVPLVRQKAWLTNPIDAFVLAGLEARGLEPSPPADRRTLARRLYFDLIGLPPTALELDRLLNDPAPDWYERLVDQLLASPLYGQRWARHWLDVARYADTKGYVFQEERRFPFAYTYRDYVIRAFNTDLPFDQFIVQQLAADRLPLAKDRQPLAALGFLTLGRRFLNNLQDIIDDRIDVTCRGFLGLTVSCARCHDHKYDPIPIEDYYSLYGVFASCSEPRELPLLEDSIPTPATVAFEKELRARQQEVAHFLRVKAAEAAVKLWSQTADYLMALRSDWSEGQKDRQTVRQASGLNPAVLRRWQQALTIACQLSDSVLKPWLALAAMPEADFASQAAGWIRQHCTGPLPLGSPSRLVRLALAANPPTTLRQAAEVYARVFEQELKDPTPATEPDRQALRQFLRGPDSPFVIPPTEVRRFLDRDARNRLNDLQRRVDEWQVNSPLAPPRAMVLQDLPDPVTPRVLLRGNANNPGPEVPRRFLKVLTGQHRQPFSDGSGRLELARAIASPDNPLTARVFVNRVWLHLFGAGLVRTPSDFGLRGEAPSHPELLDYLAARFQRDGWSVKQLIRQIVLSSTYRQDSRETPQLRQIDPDNRLLARQNRRRLDWEALRDALLAASGQLQLRAGGPGEDLFGNRRTIYTFIDRQNLPGVLRAFDFANPDTHSPQRFQTTVPQQSLFLLNSPFLQAQARKLVQRVADVPATDQRVSALYRLVYGRLPTDEELALGTDFVAVEPLATGGLTAWELYAQVLLLANEFAFID